MKFTLPAVTLLAATTGCFAQGINIGSPANGSSVTPNTSIVLELGWQSNTAPSDIIIDMGILVGIISCSNTTCPPPTNLGALLHNGSLSLVSPAANGSGPPQQNITLNIPATLSSGNAQLTVLHLALTGDVNDYDFWSNTTSISLQVNV